MHRINTVDWVLRGSLAALSIAFVAVVAKAVYDPPIHVVVAGEQAPSFRIAAETGRTVSVPNFGGKLLVLNFWATWCPPCVQETPSLSQLAADYANRGVVVLGVSVDSSDAAYRAFLQKYKPAFLTARDARIHRDYGTFMYPETYLIDGSGKVVQKIAEAADWSNPNIRQYIESLL
ncbi:MAG: TlpA family protein disulfide reductase [Acidobacteriia bacterium]|nr:TlpA family protein disulfide reductase [Terriglobia bacterium]